MIKVLCFNDPHYTEHPPVYRSDSYGEDILNKLREISEIATEQDVDAVACTGDWFHRKSGVSHSEAIKLIQVLREFKQPLVSILGNHDIIAHNFGSWKHKAAGELVVSGVIHLLDDKPYFIDKGKERLRITGTSYRYGYDDDRKAYYPPAADIPSLHLTHGTLLMKGTFFGDYTNIDDIADTAADVIFNGHYHTPQPITRMKDTLFCNIGSICRAALAIDQMDRVPSTLLLKFGKEIKYTEIHLESAKPSEEVFIRPGDIEVESTSEIREFVKILMEEAEDSAMNNFGNILSRLTKKHGYSEKVVHKIHDLLEIGEGAGSISGEATT